MELPDNINAAVGGLILANLTTLGSVIYVGAKVLWWGSRLSFKVDQNEKDINAAHAKIREVETRVNDI